MPGSGDAAFRSGPVDQVVWRVLWATSLVCLLVLATPSAERALAAPGEVRSTVQRVSVGLAHDHVRSARSASQPTAQVMLRVGVRRGCWFANRSARLTRACERQLRAAVKRLPRGTQVRVIGVSVNEPSASQNRWLAKRRARAVVLYLRAIGVRGRLPRVAVINRGQITESAVRPVTVAGALRTTVIFGRLR